MSSAKSPAGKSFDLLREIPLFAGLAPLVLGELAAAGQVLELPAQQRLFGIGDPIRSAHILVAGSIKRCTLLSAEVEKMLELVRPGQLFALSEVFSARTYASFAQTVTPSVVVALPLARLIAVAGKHSALGLRLLETIAQRHYAAEFEVVAHHALSGTQRVLDYLLHLAGDRRGIAGETTVQLDASKRLIAARLDMTPETFSRTLRQLSSDGLIVVSGRSIHIQNATLGNGGPGTGKKPRTPLRYPKMERKTDTLSPAMLVNLCGRHRMLSQRLATAWCMVARKLSPTAARGAARKFREQFESNLALVAAQPLAPGLREKIDVLAALWSDYRDLLTATPPGAEHAPEMFDRSERILAAADQLTAAAAREAATPEAHCVHVAGRNRMLTARLAKLFLFGDWQVRGAEARRLMAASRREFDANLARLGDFGADSPEITAQLAIDTEQWRALTSIIDASPRFQVPLGHAREVLAASDELLRHMDTTVKLYERFAEAKAAAGHAGKAPAGAARSRAPQAVA
jgi:CRP-like cAMP-binding protein